MEFWRLYLVALTAVLKVLIIAAIGAFLALHNIDILKKKARKHLNTMVYFVFTPALIYGSLAKTITFRSLVMLWFLPLNVLVRYIAGTVLGWLLTRITRVPRRLHGIVMGCCAAGNMGSLPIIIVPAICKERSNPFGNVNVCHRNGLAYASLTMAIGHIYHWSIVYYIVCRYSPKTNVDESTVNKETNPENPPKCSTRALAPAVNKSLPSDCIDQLEVECKVPDGQEKAPEKPSIMKQMKILVDKINLKVLFAPALMGAIIGMIIGVVPQFRKLLVGDSAPLHVVQDSVVVLGEASIPAMILLVGANLLKGLKGLGKQLPLIVGIIVVNYIALPAIGIGIVKGAVHFSLIHPDPLYQFVLLLHFALPPAVAVSTMAQLVGVGESECSVIMFATYASASVLLTLWCTIFMCLVL